MKLKTLYQKDSKGKEREWSVETQGDKVIVTHGIVGGKSVSKVTRAKAKNIGKSNETTPEQQAILEAKSKWTYQVERKDYNEDINKSGLQLRPMLASDYRKVPHRVNWKDACAQPKLDGLRLTAGNRYIDLRESQFEMMSREGETYNIPHLVRPSRVILDMVNERCGGKCIALDGEVYIHGMPLQTITSLARKYQKGKSDELEYYLFDLVIPDVPFVGRYELLQEVVSEFNNRYYGIHLVGCDSVWKENIDDLHGQYVELGYEGLILRHKSGMYSIGNRSSDLFKYKHFYDDEFKIIDVWEDKSGNAMFKCETLPGKRLSFNDHVISKRQEFDCTPKRTHKERQEILTNKDQYIGKWLKVKYQDLTEDAKPHFGVGLELRECDDNGNPTL